MGNARTPFVQDGLYVDYGRSGIARNQWLWTDGWVNIWINFLAILVTVAFARLFRLLWRIDILAAEHTAATAYSPVPRFSETLNVLLGPRANEDHILFQFSRVTEDPTIESLGWHMMLEFYEKVRPPVIRLPATLRMNAIFARDLILLIFGGLVFLGAYVGFVILSILTARLATDTTALSASPDCGVYLPSANLSTIFNISRPYEFDTQLESATWAERCYHAEDGADGCNLLLQQSINYTIEDNSNCLFLDDMCYGGASSAISFSTDAINARALGINTPGTFEFQRNTTCSPLNMNHTFIKLHQNRSEYTFSYHYGPATGFGDWTWRTDSYGTNLGKPPAYTVGVQTSDGEWTPIPELVPPAGGMTTIIFIQPQKIYYATPSDDPIFPANHETRLPDDDVPYWLYTGGRANVLACVDLTSWRDASQGENWNLLTKLPPNSTYVDRRVIGGFSLFWFSIRNSNTYQALSRRLSGALDAQARVSGFVSLPLAPQQWKVEVIHFFETSLARMQIDARNIARGVPASYPGYVKRSKLPPQMCEGTYLFVSQGYTNVNQTVSLIILILGVVIVICAVPVTNDRMLFELVLQSFSRPFAALFVYVVINFGRFIMFVFRKLFSRQTWQSLWAKSKKAVNGFVQSFKEGAAHGRNFVRKVRGWISTERAES